MATYKLYDETLNLRVKEETKKKFNKLATSKKKKPSTLHRETIEALVKHVKL